MVLALLILVPAIGGCTSTRDLIRSKNVGTREDVFTELADKTPIPKGYADLRILSSLKMHKPGYYVLDDKTHGTSDYMLLINIDGQAVRVTAALDEEVGTAGEAGTPETGEGIRYVFKKDVRLAAGAHKVLVALPEDDVAVEKEITLRERSDNILVLEPVYHAAKKAGVRDSVYVRGDPSFYKGIWKLVVVLNGRVI
jgi:hypothetical protein